MVAPDDKPSQPEFSLLKERPKGYIGFLFNSVKLSQPEEPFMSISERQLYISDAEKTTSQRPRGFDSVVEYSEPEAQLNILQNIIDELLPPDTDQPSLPVEQRGELLEQLLTRLLETVPPTVIGDVLERFNLQPIPEPIDPQIAQVVDETIKDLQKTPGRDPKLYRSALQLFRRQNSHGVYFDELKNIETNAQDDNTAVRKLKLRLEEKLQPRGYQIRRRSVYDIVPLGEEVKP